jgi:hypothetical protein
VEKKSSKKLASELVVAKKVAAPVRVVGVRVDKASQEKAAKPAPKHVRNYKLHAKKELSAAFPAIVDVLVNRAKKGSLTHTKFLFDLGGVKDKPVHRECVEPHFSFAELLLSDLVKQQEKDLENKEPTLQGTE